MNMLSLGLVIASSAITPGLVVYANDQEGGTGATTPAQRDKNGTGSASRMTGFGLNQTFTGVLVDANCSAIKNMPATTGLGAAGTTGDAAVIQDSSGVARPGAPGPGGAAENPVPGTDPPTGTRTGVGRAGAGREAGRPGDETAAGVRVDADPGDRSNVMAGASTLPRELRNCVATSNSNAYALYSEGRILHLDSESTSRIRQHLQSENQNADRTRAGSAAEPTLVRVQGRLKLNVSSVEPIRSSSRNR